MSELGCLCCQSIVPLTEEMIWRLTDGAVARLCPAHQVEVAAVLIHLEGVQLCIQCNQFSQSYTSGLCSVACRDAQFKEWDKEREERQRETWGVGV